MFARQAYRPEPIATGVRLANEQTCWTVCVLNNYDNVNKHSQRLVKTIALQWLKSNDWSPIEPYEFQRSAYRGSATIRSERFQDNLLKRLSIAGKQLILKTLEDACLEL